MKTWHFILAFTIAVLANIVGAYIYERLKIKKK